MSKTIAISLWANANDVAVAYMDLLHKLHGKASNMRYRLNEKYSGVEPEYRSTLTEEDAYRLIPTVPDSENCLDVLMGYWLESSNEIPLFAMTYGRAFDRGIAFREAGPIRLAMSLNDLGRAYRPGEKDPLKQAEGLRLLNDDSASLFETVCCSAEGDLENVIHGAMYYEYTWASPVKCSMIYHRNALDLIKDLYIIYLEFEYGAHIPPLFGLGEQIWKTRDFEINKKPGKSRLDYYESFNQLHNGDITRFLTSLDPARVRDMANLPQDRLLQWLGEVDLAPIDTKCKIINDRSVLLMSSPLLSLWRFYKLLYDAML